MELHECIKIEPIDKVSHILSGVIASRVIETVINLSKDILKDKSSILRELWLNNLLNYGGVIERTDILSPLQIPVDESLSYTRRTMEKCEPLKHVHGCVVKPLPFMARPKSYNQKHSGLYLDYIVKKDINTGVSGVTVNINTNHPKTITIEQSRPQLVAAPTPRIGARLEIHSEQDKIEVGRVVRVIQRVSSKRKRRGAFQKHQNNVTTVAIRFHDGREQSFSWPCDQIHSSFVNRVTEEEISGPISFVNGGDSENPMKGRPDTQIEGDEVEEEQEDEDEPDGRNSVIAAVLGLHKKALITNADDDDEDEGVLAGSEDLDLDLSTLLTLTEASGWADDEEEEKKTQTVANTLVSSAASSKEADELAEIDSYFDGLARTGIRVRIAGSKDQEAVVEGIDDMECMHVSIHPDDDPTITPPEPDALIVAKAVRISRHPYFWEIKLKNAYMRLKGLDYAFATGLLTLDSTSLIEPDQARVKGGKSYKPNAALGRKKRK